MNAHLLLRAGVFVTALLAAMDATAGCGHKHKVYPQGGIACVAHQQFQCGEHGSWHKLADSCEADSPAKAPLTTPTGNGPSTPAGTVTPRA
jgi:hypothetical protein